MFETEIQNGIAFLDEASPGWREKITKPVSFPSATYCVLGQIYGSFYEAAKIITGLDYENNYTAVREELINNGFLISYSEWGPPASEGIDLYKILEQEWNEAI